MDWLLLTPLSAKPVDFNDLLNDDLEQGHSRERDVDGHDEHELLPSPPSHGEPDDYLANGCPERPGAVDDACYRRLAALAALHYLLFADVSSARGRDEVVEATYDEAKEEHEDRERYLRHRVQLVGEGEAYS